VNVYTEPLPYDIIKNTTTLLQAVMYLQLSGGIKSYVITQLICQCLQKGSAEILKAAGVGFVCWLIAYIPVKVRISRIEPYRIL